MNAVPGLEPLPTLCAELGASYICAYRAVVSGALTAVRIGRVWHVLRAELEQFNAADLEKRARLAAKRKLRAELAALSHPSSQR